MSKIFEGWKHRDALQDENKKYIEFDCGHKAPIFKVNSIHALNTLVGYCKHIYQEDGNIYFRGQTSLYGSMKPSLYRGITTFKPLSRRQEKLNSLIRETSSKMRLLNKMDHKLIAPLIQHYGIQTDWLDLVDNLWVALWFSIHEYIRPESNKRHEYVRRISKQSGSTYLYLMLSDAVERHSKIPGYYKGNISEIVDLRAAAPSVFLRPHNQHAILLRKKCKYNRSC
ncbi:FRG domain-containing protein [Paenibacillus sp. AGC30]